MPLRQDDPALPVSTRWLMVAFAFTNNTWKRYPHKLLLRIAQNAEPSTGPSARDRRRTRQGRGLRPMRPAAVNLNRLLLQLHHSSFTLPGSKRSSCGFMRAKLYLGFPSCCAITNLSICEHSAEAPTDQLKRCFLTFTDRRNASAK